MKRFQFTISYLLILATLSIHDCDGGIGLQSPFLILLAIDRSQNIWLGNKLQGYALGLCFETPCPCKQQQARTPSQSYVPPSEFSSTSGTGSLQKDSVPKTSLAEGLLSSI